jgi:biotin carboxylase
MSDEQRILLVVGAASPSTGLSCLWQAMARGLEVWIIDTPANLERTPTVAEAADRVFRMSYCDTRACLALLESFPAGTPLAGVYGFREYAVETVAALAEAAGVQGNPGAAVRYARDKLACREALRARGFRQPASAACSSLEEAKAFLDAHPGGPWVVKPPDAMGSTGVVLVRHAGELERALRHVREGREALARDFVEQGVLELERASDRERFLVETFQGGDEFSAEGIFVGGEPHVLALTAKETTGKPYFVELGHTMPARVPADLSAAMEEEVRRALHSLGLCWGIFHVELWVDERGPVLGEVHLRPGGDYIHAMVEQVTGIELHGSVFDQIVGRVLDPEAWRPRRGAAVRYLRAEPGQVTAIEGLDRVTADPACLLAEVAVEVGQRVRPVTRSAERPGFVLAVGADADAAAAAADRLRDQLRIEVRSEAGVA